MSHDSSATKKSSFACKKLSFMVIIRTAAIVGFDWRTKIPAVMVSDWRPYHILWNGRGTSRLCRHCLRSILWFSLSGGQKVKMKRRLACASLLGLIVAFTRRLRYQSGQGHTSSTIILTRDNGVVLAPVVLWTLVVSGRIFSLSDWFLFCFASSMDADGEKDTHQKMDGQPKKTIRSSFLFYWRDGVLVFMPVSFSFWSSIGAAVPYRSIRCIRWFDFIHSFAHISFFLYDIITKI